MFPILNGAQAPMVMIMKILNSDRRIRYMVIKTKLNFIPATKQWEKI